MNADVAAFLRLVEHNQLRAMQREVEASRAEAETTSKAMGSTTSASAPGASRVTTSRRAAGAPPSSAAHRGAVAPSADTRFR